MRRVGAAPSGDRRALRALSAPQRRARPGIDRRGNRVPAAAGKRVLAGALALRRRRERRRLLVVARARLAVAALEDLALEAALVTPAHRSVPLRSSKRPL